MVKTKGATIGVGVKTGEHQMKFVRVFVEDTKEITELREQAATWKQAYNHVLRNYQCAKWELYKARKALAEQKVEDMNKVVGRI